MECPDKMATTTFLQEENMFDHRHYVPILKGKEGEYGALERLTLNVMQALTPLIEIPPIPWDYVNECEVRTLEDHLGRIAGKLERSWGSDRPLFLDLDSELWPATTEDNVHALTHVLASTRERGLRIIPVTGLTRGAAFQAAIKDAVSADEEGICIRLLGADFDNPSQLVSTVPSLIDEFSLSPDSVDILLDLRDILPGQRGTITLAAVSVINALPTPMDWRSLTIAATAFPEDLRGFSPDSASTTQRTEWLVWQSLVSRAGEIARLPTFGDYAISHPELTEIDPRMMRMSASLRYAADSDWLILKGRDVRTHGYDQFAALCQDLTQRSEFSGAGFSWGDEYISGCAIGQETSGNATVWRRIGTNHHLTLVVHQISNHPLP